MDWVLDILFVLYLGLKKADNCWTVGHNTLDDLSETENLSGNRSDCETPAHNQETRKTRSSIDDHAAASWKDLNKPLNNFHCYTSLKIYIYVCVQENMKEKHQVPDSHMKI